MEVRGPGGAGKKAKKGRNLRPSEINHGNVTPSITDREKGPGGITCREAVQTTVLSLTQLRKLHFPGGRQPSVERDVAGRAVIAALGLLAVTLIRRRDISCGRGASWCRRNAAVRSDRADGKGARHV